VNSRSPPSSLFRKILATDLEVCAYDDTARQAAVITDKGSEMCASRDIDAAFTQQYFNKFIWLCIRRMPVGVDTQVADPSGTCSRSIKAEDL
jgi:hypothetical protein